MSKTANGVRRVVILGAGFGGLYTAMHLEKIGRGDDSIELMLISRDNYFTMTPLLFEAGSGVLEPRHAVTPVRPLLKRTRFIEAEIEHIDFARKVIVGRHAPGQAEYEYPYDELVIALGGVTNVALIPGSEHGLTFKTLADALFLRNHLIDLFERAEIEPDAAHRQQLLTIVIIGGGLVGVELMGEIANFIKHLCRMYSRINADDVQLHLVNAGDRILDELEPELADYATRNLTGRNIRIHLNTRVKSLGKGEVHLPDGSIIRTATPILAAGVKPAPLLANLPIEKDRKGRVIVDATMRAASQPGVWALGDCAAIPDPDGNPYPPLAQHALRQARVLARNIAATMRNPDAPRESFNQQSLGTLAALGHFSGVGKVLKLRIKGFVAWWVWRTYYLLQTPRLDRRLRIMLDWTMALFFKYDVVKFDLYGEGHTGRQVVPKQEGETDGYPRASVRKRDPVETGSA